jgi:hypothetical protein
MPVANLEFLHSGNKATKLKAPPDLSDVAAGATCAFPNCRIPPWPQSKHLTFPRHPITHAFLEFAECVANAPGGYPSSPWSISKL